MTALRRFRVVGWIALGCWVAVATTGCRTGRSLTVLAINDVYRIEGIDEGASGGLARVRTLREELERDDPNVLVLHAGDALYPAMLSRLYDGGQMVDVLNHLDGDAEAFDERMFMTFGNHELDASKLEDASGLSRQVAASQFRWLSSNIVFKRDGGQPLVSADNLLPRAVVEIGGIRVGLFALTTDMKSAAYIESFGDPLEVARESVARLRSDGAEVVIGLTHLTLREDTTILRELGADGPDVIFGGHEHERQSAEVGGRWVLKADAEARTATVARLRPRRHGPPRIEARYRKLDARIHPDAAVAAVVEGWIERFDREYCARLDEPPGCLDQPLGRAATDLIGEELQIRRFETNFGDWIVDRALAAYAGEGAQIAFLNSGGLRLNRNLPAGTRITRRHVEELFAYPTRLVLLRLDGATLAKALAHAVTDWTGNGHWLQVAGLAFVHDPDSGTASRLTLLTADGARPIAPDEELLVVTNEFLVDPSGGQDGFAMLGPGQVVARDPSRDLKRLVVEALVAAGEDGIPPRSEGRICNPRRPGPCLATP